MIGAQRASCSMNGESIETSLTMTNTCKNPLEAGVGWGDLNVKNKFDVGEI